jgi:hypothetical protein
MHQPVMTEGADFTDENNLIGRLDYRRNISDVYYNRIKMSYNYNPGSEEFLVLPEFFIQEGVNLYGKSENALEYETPAYHVDNQGASILWKHLWRRLIAQIEPPGTIKGKSTFHQLNVDVLDDKRLTTAHLPNSTDGGWGFDGFVFPIDRQPNFDTGTIDWTFLNMSERKRLSNTISYNTWTPSTDPDIAYSINNTSEFEGADAWCGLNDPWADLMIVRLSLYAPGYALSPNVTLKLSARFFRPLLQWTGIYTFTITYAADGDPKAKSFTRYFLVPHDQYRTVKIDWWGHNAVLSSLIPSSIHLDWVRTYRMEWNPV